MCYFSSTVRAVNHPSAHGRAGAPTRSRYRDALVATVNLLVTVPAPATRSATLARVEPSSSVRTADHTYAAYSQYEGYLTSMVGRQCNNLTNVQLRCKRGTNSNAEERNGFFSDAGRPWDSDDARGSVSAKFVMQSDATL